MQKNFANILTIEHHFADCFLKLEGDETPQLAPPHSARSCGQIALFRTVDEISQEYLCASSCWCTGKWSHIIKYRPFGTVIGLQLAPVCCQHNNYYYYLYNNSINSLKSGIDWQNDWCITSFRKKLTNAGMWKNALSDMTYARQDL